ncbi:MAG: hypothetical protein GTN81_05405 [Proteobacteria bacterium]|nr:hypothetical protein [Pseudomonadota bacterium]
MIGPVRPKVIPLAVNQKLEGAEKRSLKSAIFAAENPASPHCEDERSTSKNKGPRRSISPGVVILFLWPSARFLVPLLPNLLPLTFELRVPAYSFSSISSIFD